MISTLLLWFGAAQADELAVTLAVTADGVAVVRATRVPGDTPSVPGELAVLDARGAVLATAPLPPLVTHRSVITPDGGETVVRDRSLVRVRVPWREGAATLDVRGVRTPLALQDVPDAAEVVRLRDAGPSAERLDLLVLAEGYPDDAQATFDADLDAVLGYLDQLSPFDAYGDLLNVWSAFVPSEDAGIDTTEGRDLLDTAFECFYGCGLGGQATNRLVCCDEDALAAFVDAAAPQADGVFVLVNDDRYGGSGGFFYSASYTGSAQALQVAAHELSHTLIGLWDEYGYGIDGRPADFPDPPNCHPPHEPPRWSAWVDPPVDWDAWDAAVADRAFRTCDGRTETGEEVCAYKVCTLGSWVRPTFDDCTMHTLQDGWCPVCTEAIVKRLYAQVDEALITSATPAPGPTATDAPVSFTATTARPPGELSWTWSLDGVFLHDGPTLVLDAPRCGSLTLEVRDATELVRSDPDGLLTATRAWTLTAATCDDTPAACGCRTAPAGAGAGAIAGLVLLLVRRRRR